MSRLAFRRPTETVIATTPSGAEYVRVPVSGVHELHHHARRGERPPRLMDRVFTYRARRGEHTDIQVPRCLLNMVLMPSDDASVSPAMRTAASDAARATGRDHLVVRVGDALALIEPYHLGTARFRGAEIVFRAHAAVGQVA